MTTGEHRQRLAAILAADVASYSRLMAADDRATVDALDDARVVFRSRIEANHGRVIDMAGDSVLAVFESVTGALNTAIAVQTELAVRASAVPEDRRMRFRIGVHLGDVIEKSDGTIYGDGVNIAARLEGIAQPGGIAISQPVHDTVRDRMALAFVDMGEHEVKNIARPVRAYFIGVDGGRAPSRPAAKAPRPPVKAGNLPAQATRFLGRAQDLGEVVALLDTTRMVTLTGVGGIGKTRLAIEAGAQASAKFPDGVWMVEFASVGDPSAVCHAVAGVIGVAQQGGKTIEQTVVESLAGRRLLMVLDNCEHLIEAVAALASAILASCAQVVLLATSREALMVDGEQTWPVPSLSFREGNASPAVELFIERAHAVAPGFKLGENGVVVSEICQRLDGIPLAIELAAARVRSMSPTQIRDRLGERFRLLTGGSRRALERHQTLRHAVQWSYDLLSPAERTVLSRASAFAGGFTLEAAEYVCSVGDVDSLDVLDTLDSLVRKSLIFVERSDRTVRYGMLETIRQFGEEQLAQAGEGESTRRVHAQCYADDSGAQFTLWRSPRQLDAYEWLDREIGNFELHSGGRSTRRRSTSPQGSPPTSATWRDIVCATRLPAGPPRSSIRRESFAIAVSWSC